MTTLFSSLPENEKSAVFDEKKLHWISGQHIFNSSAQAIFDGIRKINPDWRKNERDEYILNVIELVKLRAKSLEEFQKISGYFFEDPEKDYEYAEQQKESAAEDRADEARDMGE